jgi:thiol-disulfide isomerase/thioredoxin
VPAVFAAVAVLALGACGAGGNDGSGTSNGGNIVQGSGAITHVPKEDRQPAPELSGLSTHDEPLELTDYRGDVVVLNVWGSWCGPCRAEAPNLAAVAEATADQGVRFLGINTRDSDKRNAQSFDEGFGITYPSFYDPKGRLILEFPKNTLSPQGIPSTIVLDRDGDIAVRALKPLTEEELWAMIEPVMAER